MCGVSGMLPPMVGWRGVATAGPSSAVGVPSTRTNSLDCVQGKTKGGKGWGGGAEVSVNLEGREAVMGCEAAQQGVAAGRITCSFSEQQRFQLLPACKEVLLLAKACMPPSNLPPNMQRACLAACLYSKGLNRRRLERAVVQSARRCLLACVRRWHPHHRHAASYPEGGKERKIYALRLRLSKGAVPSLTQVLSVAVVLLMAPAWMGALSRPAGFTHTTWEGGGGEEGTLMGALSRPAGFTNAIWSRGDRGGWGWGGEEGTWMGGRLQ